MGMFDYVRVEYEVPDMPAATLNNILWQTNDLENMLSLYTIAKDGKLLCHGVDYQYTGVLVLLGCNESFPPEFYDLWVEFNQGNFVRISNRPIKQSENDAEPAQAQAGK